MVAAFAQAPTAAVGAPLQGQMAYPMANPFASVNNNNNYQAPALPGPIANPTPGTIVIHMDGKVQTTFQSSWATHSPLSARRRSLSRSNGLTTSRPLAWGRSWSGSLPAV